MIAPPDGNQNRAEWLNTVAWSEAGVATVFVALRFYSRTRITRNLWWDDWFILITLGMFFMKVSPSLNRQKWPHILRSTFDPCWHYADLSTFVV